MRVGVITQFPRDPEDPCGGVESVSVELLRGLARFEDLELHAITVDPDSAAPATGRWGSITTHRLPASTERVLTNAIGSGRKEMQRYLSGLALDVAHSHDFYGLMVAGLPGGKTSVSKTMVSAEEAPGGLLLSHPPEGRTHTAPETWKHSAAVRAPRDSSPVASFMASGRVR